MEDGVISISLKDLSLVMSLLFTVTIIGMGMRVCDRQLLKCDKEQWPMISDIISLHMFDRVFIFMTTFFMLGIMQVNMRAYYKKVYGYISSTTNDILLAIGLLACFTLPMIGLFDDQDFLIVHLRFSTAFFTSYSTYAVALATVMSRYKHRFPP